MEEMMTPSPRLLLSFVVDNSASMSEERLRELIGGFRSFAEVTKDEKGLEWEMVVFDTLTPLVVKSFEEGELRPVGAARFPLLARATELAAARILARAALLRKAKQEVFRPWLFVLSDGFTVDDMATVAMSLNESEARGELIYLPFRLSQGPLCQRLTELDRIKQMVRILPGEQARFFSFLSEMIARRTALPADRGFKFSKSDFEGWALL